MIYGYVRVSSDKQTVENQKFEINNFVKQNNIKIDKWVEETISGAKVQVMSYVGTGTYGENNPCRLTFDFAPKIVTIGYITYQYSTDEYPCLTYVNFIYPSSKSSQSGRSGTYYMYHNVKWEGNTLIWYVGGTSPGAFGQLNASDILYYVVAIG